MVRDNDLMDSLDEDVPVNSHSWERDKSWGARKDMVGSLFGNLALSVSVNIDSMELEILFLVFMCSAGIVQTLTCQI